MKHRIWMRAFALFSALTLFGSCLHCAGAEEESGVRTPDFGALVQTAAQERVPGVIVLSDAIYYANKIQDFNGRYASYLDATNENLGIIDVDGNILWRPNDPRIMMLMPEASGLCGVYMEDPSFAAGGGWQFYTVRGKRLNPENVVCCGYSSNRDWATGEERFLCGEALIKQTGEPVGGMLADTAGHCIVAESFGLVYNGLLPICKNGKWALCDLNEKTILPYDYDELSFVDEYVLLAKQNGAYRLIDRGGKTVAELPGVSEASSLAPDCARVLIKKNGLLGLCDAKGRQTSPCSYSMLSIVNLGYDSAEKGKYFSGVRDGRLCFFSEDGAVSMDLGAVTGSSYDDTYVGAFHLAKNLWWVNLKIVNDRGMPCFLEKCTDYLCRNGYLLLQDFTYQTRSGVTVCLDSELRELFRLECAHYGCQATRSAVCCIKDGAACYYSLADGTLLNKYECSDPESISFSAINDWGTVLSLDDACALTDAEGNLLTDFSYQSAMLFGDGVYALKQNGKLHLVDANGTELLDPVVDTGTFHLLLSDYTAYARNGKYGFLRYRAADEPMFIDVKKSSWFREGADFCAVTGLMNGTGEGKFAPQTVMTRAMLVRVLYNLSGTEAASFGFEDVQEGKWYTDAVNWAAENGIVSGVGQNRFAPNTPVTREQLVTILYRYAQKIGAKPGAADALSGFTDAEKVSEYAVEAMRWAVDNGIITGVTQTELSPRGTANRAQVATILMRFVRRMYGSEQ